MKLVKKMFTLAVVFCVLTCFTMSVNAIEIQYSDIWVSAGSSAYSSENMTHSGNYNSCYMRLRYIRFHYQPGPGVPSNTIVYSRLYTISGYKASYAASFTHTTSVEQYNYLYLSGYGSGNYHYKLKTNSNSSDEYQAKFDWSSQTYS